MCVYDTDTISIALSENPDLIEWLLPRIQKKYVSYLMSFVDISACVIPCGSYKGERLVDVNKEVLKRMLNVSLFQREYPLVYHACKRLVYSP